MPIIDPPATTLTALFKGWWQSVSDRLNAYEDGTADLSVPDEAYHATNWNASLEVPTKNAVRDKFEGLPSDTLLTTAYARVYVHDGSTYALEGGRIFVGTEDPVADGYTMADGDEWLDTTP